MYVEACVYIFQKEHFNLGDSYRVQDVTEIKSVDQTTTIADTGQVGTENKSSWLYKTVRYKIAF